MQRCVLTAWCGLLAACGGAPDGEPAAEAGPAVAPVPHGEVPRPPDDLFPSPAAVDVLLRSGDLGAELAGLARSVEHKCDVMVAEIVALRTGAEFGALVVEAGAQDSEVVRGRLARIRAGLGTLDAHGPAVVQFDALKLQLDRGASGAAWVALLEQRRDPSRVALREQFPSDQVPLFLAGAWLQGAWLVAASMERTGRPEPGHALLHHPEVGVYFRSYLASPASSSLFQPLVRDELERTLALVDLHTRHEMTVEDVRVVREATERLLGML